MGWRPVLRKCDPILVVVLGREMGELGELVFFMVVLW
jgi:hypothetical protein